MVKRSRTAVAALVAISTLWTATARAADGPVLALTGWLAKPRDARPKLADQTFATAKLTKAQATEAKALLWADHVAMVKADRQAEWDDKEIKAGDDTLKLLTKTIGSKPAGGWNLFISMHGGGSGPAEMNDQQWQNQIKLPYNPPNSLYIAPRSPTNSWDEWHTKQVDVLFNRLIEDAIVLADVNPNRVYVMGYSAGGDGTYQLAPRMADRWAGAAMMAGHPGDASPLSLRNLPFYGQVGALDAAYDRNKKLPEFGKKLDALQKDDPAGYVHVCKLQPGKPHWMDMLDREAIPWVLKYTRNPIPDRVAWMQDDVTHDRFYWLAVPDDEVKKKQSAVVSRKGQSITVEKVAGLTHLVVQLNDDMANLDQPVTVKQDGKTLSSAMPTRTIANLARTMAEHGDPDGVFSATVPVTVE